MDIPEPKQGMVISYSYLWHSEAQAGAEEGRKDRPCAIVLATKDNHVIVAPITHHRPVKGTRSIEIPPEIKKGIGLDYERSWIVTNEVNYFKWPGSDLRPINRRDPNKTVYGNLPPNFRKQIVEDVRDQMQRRQTKTVNRDQPPKKDWSKKPEGSGEIKKAPPPRRDPDRSR